VAASSYPKSIDLILKREAGYVDHPSDPGGCTNRGITRATLEAWRGQPVDCDDVRALTRDEAVDIYEANYWLVVWAHKLPIGIDLTVFDHAVNCGPRRAVTILQELCGASPIDGLSGPNTVAAAAAYPNQFELVSRYARAREAYYRSLPHFPQFGRGWLARVEEVETESHRLISDSQGG